MAFVTTEGTNRQAQAQGALRGARGFALEKVVPASIDRLRELAERVPADHYLAQVQRLERDFSKRARRLERKLERRAKKLPIDTALDRRRRRRIRRRRASAAATIVVVGVRGAVAYAVWRSRQREETAREGSFELDSPEDETAGAPWPAPPPRDGPADGSARTSVG